MIRRLASFIGVGVVNSLIDAGIFALLVSVAGVAPLPAHIIGFLAGALNSFIMNGTITFGRSMGDIFNLRLIVQFALTILVQFLFATGVFWAVLLASGSPYAAKLVSIALTTILTFVLLRRIFRRPG